MACGVWLVPRAAPAAKGPLEVASPVSTVLREDITPDAPGVGVGVGAHGEGGVWPGVASAEEEPLEAAVATGVGVGVGVWVVGLHA